MSDDLVQFSSPLGLGDRVHIDADDSLTAVVTAVMFRSHVSQIEISWVNCAKIETEWLPHWRLSRAAS